MADLDKNKGKRIEKARKNKYDQFKRLKNNIFS